MNDHFLSAALLALTVFAANLSSTTGQVKVARVAPSVEAVLLDAGRKAQGLAATVEVRLRGLRSGHHTITITLAGNDRAPLAPSRTLSFVVP